MKSIREVQELSTDYPDKAFLKAAELGLHDWVEELAPLANTFWHDSLAYAAANRAAENGHARFIREMAKKRLNINPDENGFKPSHFAAENGHDDVIDELAQYIKPEDLHADSGRNRGGYRGRRPIDLAAQNDHLEAVRSLLKHGAGAFLNFYSTPIHAAAKNGNVAMLQLLDEAYEKKKDSNSWIPTHQQTDGNRNTGLHIASENDHLAAVKWFLEKGADPHAKNADGKKASQLTKDEAVRILLKKAEFEASRSGKMVRWVKSIIKKPEAR